LWRIWRAGRPDSSNAIAISGNMPEHFQALARIGDPALYVAQALRDALRRAGITVTGRAAVNAVPRVWRARLAVIESPPLWQILSVVLKPSQNLYAEMLFKGLSAGGAQPASYAASRRSNGGFDHRGRHPGWRFPLRRRLRPVAGRSGHTARDRDPAALDERTAAARGSGR
jgi:hypothetical protein